MPGELQRRGNDEERSRQSRQRRRDRLAARIELRTEHGEVAIDHRHAERQKTLPERKDLVRQTVNRAEVSDRCGEDQEEVARLRGLLPHDVEDHAHRRELAEERSQERERRPERADLMKRHRIEVLIRAEPDVPRQTGRDERQVLHAQPPSSARHPQHARVEHQQIREQHPKWIALSLQHHGCQKPAEQPEKRRRLRIEPCRIRETDRRRQRHPEERDRVRHESIPLVSREARHVQHTHRRAGQSLPEKPVIAPHRKRTASKAARADDQSEDHAPRGIKPPVIDRILEPEARPDDDRQRSHPRQPLPRQNLFQRRRFLTCRMGTPARPLFSTSAHNPRGVRHHCRVSLALLIEQGFRHGGRFRLNPLRRMRRLTVRGPRREQLHQRHFLVELRCGSHLRHLVGRSRCHRDRGRFASWFSPRTGLLLEPHDPLFHLVQSVPQREDEERRHEQPTDGRKAEKNDEFHEGLAK